VHNVYTTSTDEDEEEKENDEDGDISEEDSDEEENAGGEETETEIAVSPSELMHLGSRRSKYRYLSDFCNWIIPAYHTFYCACNLSLCNGSKGSQTSCFD